MVLKEKYPILTNMTCERIVNDTLKEIETGISLRFSYQTIWAEGRKPALAARMTSKPLLLEEAYVSNGKIVSIGAAKRYSGQDVADVFVNSVKTNGVAYYPVTGTIPAQEGLEQLILFVKEDRRYLPYARFDITAILHQERITVEQAKMLVDVTPVANSNYSTLLEIKNVVTQGLPEDYLGNASAVSIYDKAFKGAAPVVICI